MAKLKGPHDRVCSLVAAVTLVAIGSAARPVDQPPTPPQAQTRTGGPPVVDRQTAPPVRVWEGTMTLPTYEEDPPDVNAPFDLFTTSRFNYPYTIRDRLTTRRVLRRWRTLNLENEYLRCSVLPDLGGHLYTCIDKVNGRDLFYANTAIKLANVAYRGAWAALGIEFNFPVSHNWMTVSPVDYRIVANPDRSASIWVGNIDRVYGGQWRVALTLKPREAVLEQRTYLYNASPRRHRFYWWTNAAVRVTDESRILYPMRHTASHGFTQVGTWPVDAKGTDLSIVGNHKYGPVSLFSHGSREGFMAVYHPPTRSGVVHYSPPDELPAKKFWSWGSDADGLDWRKALSDDSSAYVEVQAGLFRNQETYAFLEPQETISFSEYWFPIRDLGGLARATRDAALNLTRAADGPDRVTLEAAFSVTRPMTRGRLRVLDGNRTLIDEALSADPSMVVRRKFPHLAADARYTFELQDAAGTLVRHTEEKYDFTPSKDIRLGPQPMAQMPPSAQASEAQVAEVGTDAELDGRLLEAYRQYTRGLERFPESFELHKAIGRLALQLKRSDEAVQHLNAAAARVSNDAEIEYYTGLALQLLDDDAGARAHFEHAAHRAAFRAAAGLELARLDARAGRLREASALLDSVVRESPASVRAGLARIAVLRHLGRLAEARLELHRWQAIDPTSNGLRYEAVLLGRADADLWPHLAADPERLIEITVDYLALGFFGDAADLLAHRLPSGPAIISEPGMPAADANPLVSYYRAYCRLRAGLAADTDFQAAARKPPTYIFPNRSETYRVLRAALQRDPTDATAGFLLGSLYLSGGQVEPALEAWTAARRQNPRIPGLHRNLGLTYLIALERPEQALEVFREGLDVDPQNIGLYIGIDQALSLTNGSAAERAAALGRYPDQDNMPATVSFKLALALAEAGGFDEADRIFVNRFFASEELGTNVRDVYVEVRLLRARAAARHQQCADALAVVDHLTEAVEGIAFTRDGLGTFLQSARRQQQLGEVEAACERPDRARARWRALGEPKTTFPALDLTFAYRATREACETGDNVCRADVDQAWRPRLEQSLAAATRQVEAAGTSASGTLRCAQGLLLAALGRADDAKSSFDAALLAPDRALSHHLAREGLGQ
jgi:tetratricopeptide (TPR) repeat protein